MNKKLTLIIVLIAILIIGGIFIYYTQIVETTIRVGDTDFNLPKGYHKGVNNNLGAVNITNGHNEIYIYQYNDNETAKHATTYKNSINQSQNITIENFTIDDSLVYKTNNKDSPYKTHYWFNKNNRTFDVYTWDGNKDLENIVMDFIKS